MEQQQTLKTKAFKMLPTEIEALEIALKGFEGATQAEQLRNAIMIAEKTMNHDLTMSQLPDNVAKVYAGDKEKIQTALSMIMSVFESQATTVNAQLQKREDELLKVYNKELDKLTKDNDSLFAKNEGLEEQLIKFKESLEARTNEFETQQAEFTSEIDTLKTEKSHLEKEVTIREEMITDLKVTIQKQDADIEAKKQEIDDTNKEIADLAKDAREDKIELKSLRDKSELLSNQLGESTKYNSDLSNENNLLQVKVENLESKVADLKVQNAKYEDEVAQLKAQVQAELQKQVDMQQQLMQLMSQMTQQQPKEDASNKENDGK